VSRAQLLEHVLGRDFDGSPNIVDVYNGYHAQESRAHRPAAR
jgi:DNA-binding response OmpR family regulator